MVLVVLPHVGKFRAFEEVDILYALKCKHFRLKPRWARRGRCDAVALGNIATSHMETAGDSCKL